MPLLDFLVQYYSNITPLQVAILLSILFLYILRSYVKDLDVPPGPKGIPLFGYWPFLKTNTCHKQLRELSKKYGDVFSFRVNGRLFIHLGSNKSSKEVHLTKSEFFERRFTDCCVLTDAFGDGLFFLNGEPWKVLRRFFLLKFKDYGMHAIKENTSCSVYDALRDTVDELLKTKGRPVKIADLATSKCMIVVRRIILNDEGITGEELQELIDHYAVVVNTMTSTNFLLMGNFPRYFILPFMPNYWAGKRSGSRIEEILSNIVERHKAEYDEKQICNLIDSYLKERDDRLKRGDPTAKYFTDKYLIYSLGQFITDGILTVGIMVGVFLSTLVERPEEQEKIYKEIFEVIGSDRLPTMDDKAKLPYTNAFMYEVMRHSDFFPMYPSMQCTKETIVCGYKIPKGSISLVNLYAIHRNPESYENPDEFNPSRFLSKPRPDLPLLFGVGKRSCIGEAFSMIETFLIVTTIVQNFRLTFPEGLKGSDNMFWSKERVHFCALPRSHK